MSETIQNNDEITKKINNLLSLTIIFLVISIVLVPIVWVFLSSLKTQNEIYLSSWLPQVPQWGNYLEGLTTFSFGRYFFNTILVTGINMVMGTLLASITAFALARLDFPGKNIVFGIVLATMMLPYAAYMVPSFVLFRWFGWIDTYTVLTVPFFLAVPGFFVFLMRQYYLTIPRDFDEAAKIDGCNFYLIYWYIILPLSKPALTTVAIYSFMANWEELIAPALFINSESMRTVSIGLTLLSQTNEEAPHHHLTMAISVIFLIIPVILFFFFQKNFRSVGQGGLDSIIS